MNFFKKTFNKKNCSLFIAGVIAFTSISQAQIETYSRVRDVGNPATQQVLDMTISLHRNWNDLTAAMRSDYEQVIRHWANGVFEMTNGGHKLGKIRIFTNGRFSNAADVVWVANTWPSANLNGFTTSPNRRINMSDAFGRYAVPGNASQLMDAGYCLAHETGHYVYSLRDEYSILAGDVVVEPSIMNSQWNALNGHSEWLNFSTENNYSALTNQGRTWGVSGWELLIQNPINDPAASLANTGGITRLQYPLLNILTPTAANNWTNPNGTNFTWMRVEIPSAGATDSLQIIWMGNNIDIDLVLDKSGSMYGQPMADVKTAAKAFVTAINNFATNMQLTPSLGITAFSSTPDNPPTYPLTPLTSANIGQINTLIDGITAGGTTAMYDACLASYAKLTAGAPNTSTRLCMLLTDGAENASNERNPANVVTPFRNNNIPIYTFGYGDGASHDNCQALSSGTNGTFYSNLTSAGTIVDEWLRIFDRAADLQYAKNESFDASSSLDFSIDPTVSSLIIQTTYQVSNASSYCHFTIRDHNGNVVPSSTEIIVLNNAYPREEVALVSISSQAVANASSGNWTCTVQSSGLVSPAIKASVKLNNNVGGTYALTISDNGRGFYTYPAPVILTASVGKGDAITGLNAAATITTPSGIVNSVALNDNGQNGDALANDGIYSIAYNSYTENGQYIFNVHFDNNSATAVYAIEGNEYSSDQNGQTGPTEPEVVADRFVRENYSTFQITGVTDVTPIQRLMGFDDASMWSMLWSAGTLSNNFITKSQGSSSMQISGNGWQQFKSIDINTNELPSVTNRLLVDLFIGGNQTNLWWLGQIQLYINCPSANIYNQYVGLAELTNLPLDNFSTLGFTLPQNIMDVLNGNHTDLSISLSINTNSLTGPYYFDNMRFGN
jgi:hypothetical protein